MCRELRIAPAERDLLDPKDAVPLTAEVSNRMYELEDIADRLSGIEDPAPLLRGILYHAPSAIQVLAADGHLVFVNKAFVELFKEHPPPGWNVFQDPISRAQGIVAMVQRILAGETVHVPSHWFVPRVGTEEVRLGTEISAFPLRDAEGSVRYMVAVYKDVTAQLLLREERDRQEALLAELRAANEALRRTEQERAAHEEVLRRADDLELENLRIAAASRYKSELLASMSHELRTPLNAIIGFTELLHDGEVEPGAAEHHEFLGDILTSARHLLQLINDVLDLAKVEAGKLELRPEPVELAAIVAEVRSVLRPIRQNKHITLAAHVDPSLGEIVLDPGRMKQVLYNYLSNALKFTPDGGHVTVRVAPEQATTFRVEVQDDGPGISPGDVARLFTDFQQLETGFLPDGSGHGPLSGGPFPRRNRGTGLGLALTRRLVEAQGGQVGVHSVPGAGSVFFAILPRRWSPAPPISARHEAALRSLRGGSAVSSGFAWGAPTEGGRGAPGTSRA